MMVKVEATPGYLIFFDDVRVDPFVKSFSATISCDGSIGRGNIEMVYMPEFDRIDIGSGEITFKEDAIENMTNVKIFIKNIFNSKYTIVFDGNIRSKSVTESPSGYSLVYGIVDHTEALTKTIAPLAIPVKDSILGDTGSQDIFRLSSQGIDHSQIDTLTTAGQLNFKGKNIEEVVNIVKRQALLVNRVFSDKGGVMYWNGASERIIVMGDISEKLRQEEILDLALNPNALSVDNMYILINSLVQKLMFEFYQDRDGSIRIKPPYWNEKIPFNHIIDDSLIINSTFHSSWESMYSRIITTGSMDQVYQQNMDNIYGRTLYTPMGTFVGELGSQGKWADSKGSTANAENTASKWGGKFSANQTGVDWLDKFSISENWSPDKRGCEWTTSQGSSVKHIGSKARVIARDLSEKLENVVIVKVLEGAYAGFEIMYAKLKRTSVNVGQILSNGVNIGSSSEKLRIEVWTDNYGISKKYGNEFTNIETVDPIVYCRDVSANVSTPTMFAIESMNMNDLLSPSNFERKYGVAVLDILQPLIKFSNTEGALGVNAYDALKKYSAFMFDMLNSMANTSTVQLIGAPWIRPGFNAWVSPLKTDKVYYVTSVTHTGDPQNGTFTTLRLAHGRDSKAFFLGNESTFGTMKTQKDNIFINDIKEEWLPENAFGPVIDNVESYLNLKKRIKEFHDNFGNGIIKAYKDPLLTSLYGNSGKINFGYDNFTDDTFKKSPFNSYAGGRLTGIDFSNDMTFRQIQAILEFMYKKAPAVVKTRASKNRVVFEMARKKPNERNYDYKKYDNDPVSYDNSSLSYSTNYSSDSEYVNISTELKLGYPSRTWGKITGLSLFGRRPHPILKDEKTGKPKIKFHSGIDIGKNCNVNGGDDIIASERGTVIFSGWNGGYGNYVRIDHGKWNGVKVETAYAHASKLLVKNGQQVKKGDVIAKVGTTGLSTGDHIHFEVRINGRPVDPLSYIGK